MKKIKVGKPIKYKGKDYQFYSNENALELPSVRHAFLQEQLEYALNLKSQKGELTKFAEHINYNVYTPEIEGLMRAHENGAALDYKQAFVVLEKALMQAKLLAMIMQFKDASIEVALEPSVMACCYILFLDKEGDDPTANLSLKKEILYSDLEQLSFFFNFLYRESSKLTGSEVDLGSFIVNQHRELLSSPEWNSSSATLNVHYRKV